MRRRLRIVPFMRSPMRINHNLESELMREAGKILQWMIEGCLQWQRDELPVTARVDQATKEYFDEQDVTRQWIDACCERGQRTRRAVLTSAS
jgi:putative DNA primase/helicase